MGCGCSVEEREAKSRSKATEKSLRHDNKKSRQDVKILLLGAGESGKTTIFKQIKCIHGDGFTEEDRRIFKPIIYSNTIWYLIAIIKGMEKLNIDIEDEKRTVDAKLLFQVANRGDKKILYSHKLSKSILLLWEDKGIQESFRRSEEIQLNESASYFLKSIDRITKPDYRPTEEDILRTRVSTTCIAEIQFTWNKILYRILDVGGQRRERKKWFVLFQQVQAIVYVAALNCYDLKLAEDDATNCMLEDLKLFNSVINNEWFKNTVIVLLLNKKDLFERKIGHSPLIACFPDYTGSSTFDSGIDFIREKYLEQNNAAKKIFVHLTCATDTENIDFVFKDIRSSIIEDNLKKSCLM